MASDLRTRAVLAPTMLAVVGAIYWLDLQGHTGLRQGALSGGLLALLGVAGAWEYVQLLRGAGFAVAGKTLVLFTTLLLGSAFPFGWNQVDHEFYPLVLGSMLLLFPLAGFALRRRPDGAPSTTDPVDESAGEVAGEVAGDDDQSSRRVR